VVRRVEAKRRDGGADRMRASNERVICLDNQLTEAAVLGAGVQKLLVQSNTSKHSNR